MRAACVCAGGRAGEPRHSTAHARYLRVEIFGTHCLVHKASMHTKIQPSQRALIARPHEVLFDLVDQRGDEIRDQHILPPDFCVIYTSVSDKDV